MCDEGARLESELAQLAAQLRERNAQIVRAQREARRQLCEAEQRERALALPALAGARRRQLARAHQPPAAGPALEALLGFAPAEHAPIHRVRGLPEPVLAALVARDLPGPEQARDRDAQRVLVDPEQARGRDQRRDRHGSAAQRGEQV